MVHLNNNGYEGVVVAINPSVPEDERLIQSIKVRRVLLAAYLHVSNSFSPGRFDCVYLVCNITYSQDEHLLSSIFYYTLKSVSKP